ncbi:methyltransferase domain-containing protein [Suttonella ornithocola]|uniref:Putative S-adenosyl-L-methionine-dependent methyltransferase n=1 Tax=Suttonella ornithocola TaxID=279832 RepID=A0A380MTL7_9GAMM|nr:methyltransferase domain-containing protein [Suttonella ornithocola]SUO95618.1 putative S-adenosyl-L-methionine-dependent methyltransferase [Suttonella ornithocola]
MKRGSSYFAEIDAHFLKAIYHSSKGAIRLAVLQRDLAPLLQNTPPLQLLDIGGGAGQMALWCAKLGHHVTVIDISEPLLQKAKALAASENLSHQISFLHGDIFTLAEQLEENSFDGVLCHAVLEWIANGTDLFNIARSVLKNEGFFSLMYYNRIALEFTQHVFGNFDYVDASLVAKKRAKLTPDYPREMLWVETQLSDLSLIQRSGIRCFYDYMKPKDREVNSLENIIAHELALSSREEFFPVARYLHEIRKKTA